MQEFSRGSKFPGLKVERGLGIKIEHMALKSSTIKQKELFRRVRVSGFFMYIKGKIEANRSHCNHLACSNNIIQHIFQHILYFSTVYTPTVLHLISLNSCHETLKTYSYNKFLQQNP